MLKTIIEAIAAIPNVRAVYHDYAPELSTPPYVVVQLVGGGGNQFIDTQTAGGYERRLQVAVWANERAQAMQISGQIEQKLLELHRVAADSAGTSDYDYEVNLRGMRQDFMFIS
jgi:hypothetical protein